MLGNTLQPAGLEASVTFLGFLKKQMRYSKLFFSNPLKTST